MGRIGFTNYDKEAPTKATASESEAVLNAYFRDQTDSGRFTSEEIAFNLRETIKITTAQVFDYMSKHGCQLEREDDRLVWVIK